jgi:hypothetical protein
MLAKTMTWRWLRSIGQSANRQMDGRADTGGKFIFFARALLRLHFL